MDLMITKKQRQSDDHLIPMINIVFLILIFFMIAGQIQKSLPEGIELPSGETGQTAEQERIELYLNASGQLALNNTVLSPIEFEEKLLQATDKIWVLIADKTIVAKQLDEILQTIQAAGVTKLRLMTQGLSAEL